MPREIPQYISQLSMGSMPKVQYSNAQAESTQQASAQLGAIATDMQQKSEKINKLNAQVDIASALHEIGQKNPADPNTAKQSIDSYISGLTKGNADPELIAYAKMHSLSIIDSATNNFNKNLDSDHQFSIMKKANSLINLVSQDSKLISSPIPEQANGALQRNAVNLQQLHDLSNEVGSDGTQLMTPQAKMQLIVESGKAIMAGLPLNKMNDVLGIPTNGVESGSFQSVMKTVAKNEGGFNPIDGNTGKAVLFGITEKWHKEAFDKVNAIYQTQGKAAGQAAANEFYKTEYWDKYKLEQLNPQVRGIVMDGVINHSQAFSQKLVDEARNGATANQLLDMREAEYKRLADSPNYNSPTREQDILSWSRRINGFNHLRYGEYIDAVDPAAKEKLKEEMIKQSEALSMLWKTDPQKAAVQQGASSLQEAAQLQVDMGIHPDNIQPMQNADAKATVEMFKTNNNPDDTIKKSREIVGQFGAFAEQGIRQLVKEGLPPEIEAAMVASAKNPSAAQIPYYHHAAKQKDGELNAALVGITTDKAVNLAIADAYANNEVYSINTFEFGRSAASQHQTREQAALNKAVKSYIVANPTVSVDDAVKFFIEPDINEFQIGRSDGIPFKIPHDKKADAIEDAMSAFRYGVKKELSAQSKEGYSFTKDIVPVYDAKQNDYRFTDLEGNPIYDKNNKPVRITMNDLLKIDVAQFILQLKVDAMTSALAPVMDAKKELEAAQTPKDKLKAKTKLNLAIKKEFGGD